MLHFTLRNIAWCISKCCFEVLCEIVVLYITLRNVTLYSLKFYSMKKRMLQKTLGGQSSFSLSLICRADLVRHISQRTQFFCLEKVPQAVLCKQQRLRNVHHYVKKSYVMCKSGCKS